MSYEVPVCDCGGKLIYNIDEVYTHSYRITKKGMISKRRYDLFETGISQAEHLACEDCSQIYDFDYDEKNRIIRK